jgi:gluconate 2-dehydrogenase gamma chain
LQGCRCQYPVRQPADTFRSAIRTTSVRSAAVSIDPYPELHRTARPALPLIPDADSMGFTVLRSSAVAVDEGGLPSRSPRPRIARRLLDVPFNSEVQMSEYVKDSVREPSQSIKDRRVSRRRFLKGSSAAVASASAATVGTVAVLDGRHATAQDAATPPAGAMPGMDTTDRAIAFFNIHEAQTVDALVSRILPGTPDDPGAHEAGVVFYIDRVLGGPTLGYSLKTYTQGPFLVVSEEPVSVEAASSRDIYDYVSVAQEQTARYGYQSVLTPQEFYRRGLGFVDDYAQSQFQKDFIDLSAEQQDQVLTDMEADKATGFDGPSGKAFFTQLRNDTIEGMFSDPMYGGNRDMVGWKLVGYPGAQRFYTPDDIKNPDFQREPQSIAQLMAKEGH